jgi:acetyl esterase/lipase
MFVSGGGWSSGSKDWVANVGAAFASKGIGVTAVDHRLQPDVTYSEQVDDLARAFAWIKGNIAGYNGDPARIVVGGHSAGGHLIGLLATGGQYLDAVGRNLNDISGVLLVSAALDVGNRFGAGEAQAASPINHVRAGLPPFLLLSAEDDMPGINEQAGAMKLTLETTGVPVESVTIPRRDHFNIVHYIGAPADLATQTMYNWLISIFTNEA